MVTLIDEPDVPEKRRVIRYIDDEEAAQPQNQPSRLRRRASVASSVASVQVNRRSIDPTLVIPIEYRTLYVSISTPSWPITNRCRSFHIGDTQERKTVEARKTNNEAASG